MLFHVRGRTGDIILSQQVYNKVYSIIAGSINWGVRDSYNLF